MAKFYIVLIFCPKPYAKSQAVLSPRSFNFISQSVSGLMYLFDFMN